MILSRKTQKSRHLLYHFPFQKIQIAKKRNKLFSEPNEVVLSK